MSNYTHTSDKLPETGEKVNCYNDTTGWQTGYINYHGYWCYSLDGSRIPFDVVGWAHLPEIPNKP